LFKEEEITSYLKNRKDVFYKTKKKTTADIVLLAYKKHIYGHIKIDRTKPKEINENGFSLNGYKIIQRALYEKKLALRMLKSKACMEWLISKICEEWLRGKVLMKLLLKK